MANLEFGSTILMDTMGPLAKTYGIQRAGSGKGFSYVKGLSSRIDRLEQEVHSLKKELVQVNAAREADQKTICALRESLEDLEDAFEGEAAMEEAREGPPVSWEDAKRDLGL